MRKILLLLFIFISQTFAKEAESFQWTTLPDLPRAVSGQFVGVSHGALLTAGGAFFRVSPFQGGQKQWTREIFLLEQKTGQWETGFTLAHPLAYGASVTLPEGLLCIGGMDGKRVYRDVFLLRWQDGSVVRTDYPPLPQPCAMAGAALLGNVVYVIGGQDQHEATHALHNFWALDINDLSAGWRKLSPWPGPARILPVVAALGGSLYLFSGCDLFPGADGTAGRTYLADAYCYTPGSGWKRIADVPQPVAAAQGLGYGQSHILIFSGDDGHLVDRIQELKDNHPGFSRDVLAYHTIPNTWSQFKGEAPAVVTTRAVQWGDKLVIPGGEDRPGHRSKKVYAGHIERHASHFGVINSAVLISYLIVLVAMGLYFSRREKTTNDFFLAGQRIPWWAAGLSIFGTQLSAITFMAVPAKAYATNWVYILNGVTIVLVAPLVVYFYLPFFRRLHVTTAYEYLEKRFNVGVRLFASTVFILFQLGRMAIVLYLPAIALATATGLNIYTSILIMGLLCTAYTVLGGMEAVIWTDVLQVGVLLGGALLSLIVILMDTNGGFVTFIHLGAAEQKFHIFNWTWNYTVAAVWVLIVGNLFANLMPYTADQTVVQRYLTTSDEKQAARSIWTNALMTMPALVLFFSIGTALYVFYKNHPSLLNVSLSSDAIFPWFISQQLPVGISGLVIAGLFAASMSSLDSSMNSIATAVITDFYRRFNRAASDTTALVLARWLTVLLGIIGTGTALAMATFNIQSLWDLFLKLLSLLSGGLTGFFFLGIFTRRAHGNGALIGGILSAVIVLAVQSFTDVHFFLYAAIGVSSSVIIGYLASLVLPAATTRSELSIYNLKELGNRF